MAYNVAPFYGVSASVGRGGANFQDDVMLVQFFMYAIGISSTWNTFSVFSNDWVQPSLVDAIFPINGIYAPALSDWILSFQQFAGRTSNFGPLIQDGVVSHSPMAWGDNRVRQPAMWRTIQAFNKILFLADRNRFSNLASDRDVPVALQNSLQFLTCIAC